MPAKVHEHGEEVKMQGEAEEKIIRRILAKTIAVLRTFGAWASKYMQISIYREGRSGSSAK